MARSFIIGNRKKLVIVIFILLFICFVYMKLFSMRFLPEGKFLDSYYSPNQAYKINAYIHEPAMSGDAIRCEVEEIKTNKRRNIYWQYGKSSAVVQWLDNEYVSINGKTMNVFEDTYDWRKEN